MSNTKPVIVLVHGAWHQPLHYSEFANRLRNAGFGVYIPSLPTCQLDTQFGASMYDDAKAVREQVVALVNKGQDVMMLLHSYGGAAGSEAVKGLSKSERGTQPGGVVCLVYMCAFMLQSGECVSGASLPRPDPDPVGMDKEKDLLYITGDPVQMFYGDLDLSVAKRMEGLLVNISARAFTDAVNHDPWKIIPTTYLKCDKDGAIFPAWQQKLIDAVKATGTEIKVESYESSHSPFLSMPDKILKAIERCCNHQ